MPARCAVAASHLDRFDFYSFPAHIPGHTGREDGCKGVKVAMIKENPGQSSGAGTAAMRPGQFRNSPLYAGFGPGS